MKRRRRIMTAALIGVLLQCAAGVAVAAQIIVCRTPGGHVAIESHLDGDCCLAAVETRVAHELSAVGCDGCVDTPLFHASLSSAGRVTGVDAVVGLPIMPPPPVARLYATGSGSMPPASTAHRLQSVVLLI